MKKPDDKGVGIEAILDDLYANEINVALSWHPERGFHATLGNPPLAEKIFPRSGAAVRWLKDQAQRHSPHAEFRMQAPDSADREPLLDDLCASSIAGSISWIWDGGFYATLGEPKLAEKWSAASAREVLDWLRDQAIFRYPGSAFAGRYAGFGFRP
jgi:disulfide oxidoreductase YuzD